MKRINILVIGLMLILIITACSTGRIDSLERKVDECIVIAKVFIKNYYKDITKETNIVFRLGFWTSDWAHPDDSNYIYLKLPLGKHHIACISYNTRAIYLTERMLNFETPESGIYYLGDIYAVLTLDVNYNYDSNQWGLLKYKSYNVAPPPIWIKNNIDNAISYFNSIFPNNETIIQCKFQGDTSSVFSEYFITDSSKVKKSANEIKHDLRIKHIK